MVISAMSFGEPSARERGVIITHPNRDKPIVQGTRVTVILLLLASAALVLIITIGGWSVLQGAVPIQIGYVIAYLTLAFFAGRWNRGVLPVAAALAIILAIFGAVAVPAWMDRDASGFHQPAIDASVLGLICALLVPVQVLLIAFAMRGFNQAWNVEVERRPDVPSRGATPQPA
jgi:presenilin-like A22 family membrane protease